MFVIGLTGGIGTGKSTVADFFKQYGITIIDTDLIARNLTSFSKPVIKKIRSHFGSNILDQRNQINRRKLRSIIFKDQKEKKWLERLLHPLIIKELRKQIKSAHSTYCILVVPLLFEYGKPLPIDRILVVDSKPELQIKRTQIRDKTKKKEIITIMSAQALREHRLKEADDILKNDASLMGLKRKVLKLHQIYLKLAK